MFLSLKNDEEAMIKVFQSDYTNEIEIRDCLIPLYPPVDKVEMYCN